MDSLDPSGRRRNSGGRPIGQLLTRALKRARGSILWERLWPALASLVTALGLFLAFSWAGLWLVLPPIGRAIGLFIFLLIAAAAAVPLVLLRLPSVREGLRRLDRGSGEQHRPATAIADKIAIGPSDPVTQALWRAHRVRAQQAARKLRAGWPSPRLALRDPLALRALVLLLVVAGFFAAGGERFKRITAAFDWQGVVAPANFRIDAWVTPPVYTGRPPVMLPGLRPGETAAATALPERIQVPTGSRLVVRSTGQVNFEVIRKGGVEFASAEPGAPLPAGTEEQRFVINGSGSAALHGVGQSDLVWNFTAIPDQPPSIALVKAPERQARGAVRLDYQLEDDYGVVEAKATFTRKPGPNDGETPRPLFGPPDIKLTLPQARTRNGIGQTTRDVTDHPWAGTEVIMTLTARDEAGNEGRSEPHEFKLPQRLFVKPIARALVEQRQVLALDANAKPLVETALDALTLAPEKFDIETKVYLGLRSIFWLLTRAETDDELREVAARMWDMAIRIEDGDLSETERALRQAQEDLRRALERGATDEEIKKLTEQLREALNKFMQALAEQMRRNPQQLSRPLDRNSRILTQRDLKNMIDRMEQLARQGNKEAAQRLLEQLQQMLENLRMARPGAPDEGEMDDDMMSALDELGDMIRKQQQLRDRTFREGQQMQRERRRGQRGQGQPQMGDLRRDQQALRERLKELLEQLRQRGLSQGKDGQKGPLGEAGEEMGEAEGQLGQGDADGAVDSQGRALEAMRRGAQGLAQSMQQNGFGPGPGRAGRRGQPRAQRDTDPLGRPLRGREYGDDTTVKVPGEIDVQRARRILEELRRRFSDPGRPQLELEYIERLLKDF